MALETEVTEAETRLNPFAAMMGYPGLYWWQSSKDLQTEIDPSSQPSSMWTQFAIGTGLISADYLAREKMKSEKEESKLVLSEQTKKKEMRYASAPDLRPAEGVQSSSIEYSQLQVIKTEKDEIQNKEEGINSSQSHNQVGEKDIIIPSISGADFTLHSLLGKGRFGEVMLATHNRTHTKIALKILHKKLLLNSKMRERARNERMINGIFFNKDCPFVVVMSHAFATEKHLCLALEVLPCGDLFQLATKHTAGSFSGKTSGRKFPEKAVRFYLAECILALKFVHEQAILYRDLKPENVLINRDGHIKISDFGLSKANIKHALKGASSMCGTPEYMAPEMLSEANRHEHGLAVDWWALGALFYELVDGHPPWYAKDRLKLFEKIIKTPLKLPKLKPKLSTDGAALLKALLEKSPSARIGSTTQGAIDIQQHRFFSMVDFDALYQRKVEPPFLPTTDAFAIKNNTAQLSLDWTKIDAPDPPRKADISSQRFNEIFKHWNFAPSSAAWSSSVRMSS